MILGFDAAVFAAWAQVGGATATLLAVAVALWVAIRDGKHRERDHQEELAGQARTILLDVDSGHNDLLGRFYAVVVHNYSNAPITDITVIDISAVFAGEEHTTPKWSLDDEGGPMCRVLPAGKSCGSGPILFSFKPGKWVCTPQYPLMMHSVVTYAFTDARGIRWRREGNKQPQRIPH